jgi:AraC-like DNA-binding protein
LDAPEFVQRVRERAWESPVDSQAVNLLDLDFDLAVFGAKLPTRKIDQRILFVLGRIKEDPSAPAVAEEYANMVNLSFSRFLHLFKQEVGAPFRSFRTWKRARNLLNYVVNHNNNLLYVALGTGYPDSTHFSHTIRRVYGLKPSEIFAGSRRLAVYGQPAAIH